MSKNKDFDNTVLAMSEWLDERMDGYLMLLTKDGQSGMIMNGDSDDIVESLASGMVEHKELRAIVLKAVGMAMLELDILSQNGEEVDGIDLFNMN